MVHGSFISAQELVPSNEGNIKYEVQPGY
jgi:hypothetical protein